MRGSETPSRAASAVPSRAGITDAAQVWGAASRSIISGVSLPLFSLFTAAAPFLRIYGNFGSEQLGELRENLVHVSDKADVAVLEDGGLGVLVDGDDEIRLLHTCYVLDGS